MPHDGSPSLGGGQLVVYVDGKSLQQEIAILSGPEYQSGRACFPWPSSSLQNLHNCKVVDCSMFKGSLQGGPAIIEIEIGIEIGKLPEIDFDHDFDFDTDPEHPWFENKIALGPAAIWRN